MRDRINHCVGYGRLKDSCLKEVTHFVYCDDCYDKYMKDVLIEEREDDK